MNSGEITGNNASEGAGVRVSYGGNFTMNGGKIFGNGNARNGGGGVSVDYGTFVMNGGEVSNNTAPYGGGIYVAGGTFTMNGGEVSGNISDGFISESTFTDSFGGGIYVARGTFTMNGGEVSGNTLILDTRSYIFEDFPTLGIGGAGVCINRDAVFQKTGGIITGYSTNATNGNVVKDNNSIVQNNRGHAVYVRQITGLNKRKETTAGEDDNLIYISKEPDPPTISGAWDY
jgi:hypothetical protein